MNIVFTALITPLAAGAAFITGNPVIIGMAVVLALYCVGTLITALL